MADSYPESTDEMTGSSVPCETNFRQQCQPDEEKNWERQFLALLTPALMGDPFIVHDPFTLHGTSPPLNRQHWLQFNQTLNEINLTAHYGANVLVGLRSLVQQHIAVGAHNARETFCVILPCDF